MKDEPASSSDQIDILEDNAVTEVDSPDQVLGIGHGRRTGQTSYGVAREGHSADTARFCVLY